MNSILVEEKSSQMANKLGWEWLKREMQSIAVYHTSAWDQHRMFVNSIRKKYGKWTSPKVSESNEVP